MAREIATLPVEVVWLTTWRGLANSHIGRWLEWAPHRVVDGAGEPDPHRWKTAAVVGHVEAGGRPFVWIDDDLDAMRPLIGGAFANHRHLLVCPDSRVGLTRRQLDQVEAFLLGLE